jgi:hypothetical protein
MIHYAKISNSQRLMRVLAFLSDGQIYTTREIQQNANVCNAHTCVSELRANGYEIPCTCIGRGRFVYRLIGQKKAAKA